MVDSISNEQNHPGKPFYENWACQELAKPGRNIVLEWKAVHMANLFRRNILGGPVASICEIGGAEGTVIASVGRLLDVNQLDCYELSNEFCQAGSVLNKKVNFINEDFVSCRGNYDVCILSDITEHVENDGELLDEVSKKCRYVLLKMPVELCWAGSRWRYRLQGREKPLNMRFGKDHYNGHLRGYTVSSALKFVDKYFSVVDYYVVDPGFYYSGSRTFLRLRRWFGWLPLAWLVGGSIFVLGIRR